MSIECPIDSRFKIVHANGAIVDNFYTTPIAFKCSSSNGVAVSSGGSRLSALTPILDSNLIAKLRLYGINLKSTVFWIGHTTGVQVVAAHCYRPRKFGILVRGNIPEAAEPFSSRIELGSRSYSKLACYLLHYESWSLISLIIWSIPVTTWDLH
jgi:hypothetical protein